MHGQRNISQLVIKESGDIGVGWNWKRSSLCSSTHDRDKHFSVVAMHLPERNNSMSLFTEPSHHSNRPDNTS